MASKEDVEITVQLKGCKKVLKYLKKIHKHSKKAYKSIEKFQSIIKNFPEIKQLALNLEVKHDEQTKTENS